MIDTPVFLFDCQTTGSQPEHSFLIEAAWGLFTARQERLAMTHVRIALPEGETIPKRIQRLTGIGDEVEEGEVLLSYQDFCERFFQDWMRHEKPPLLIHFAQFERPFLLSMARDPSEARELEQAIVCTHRLAKRLLPGLRSYSLRAVAGYCDFSLQELKRSNHHLQATAHIWQHLAPLLSHVTAPSQSQLVAHLQNYQPKEAQEQRFHSKVDSAKRLSLPQKAGIYRMLDKTGSILYVGKAKNLKSRVNSYFRGRGSKGSRINELLTRVDDIDVQVCASELEALMRESDEIKRFEPPYNRLLKAKFRQLLEVSIPDLGPTKKSMEQRFYGKSQWGPFPSGLVQDLQNLWYLCWEAQDFVLWGRSFTADVFREAQAMLLRRHDLADWDFSQCQSLWQKLGVQTISLRRQKQEELYQLLQTTDSDAISIAEDEESEEEIEIKEAWEAEELSFAWEKVLCHMIYRSYQLRWLLRLVESHLVWQDEKSPGQIHSLAIKHGDYDFATIKSTLDRQIRWPESWQSTYCDRKTRIDVAGYDRLGIVYRFLRRLATQGQSFRLSLRPGLVLDEVECRKLIV